VVAAVRSAGFRFVALDLEGFRSGSMNRMLDGPVDLPLRGGTEETT
jgi:PP-loop superfamily ATP-utilizing enzyme